MDSQPPTEFVSDGGSGFLSFFWEIVFRKAPPWEGCCLIHDKAYWQGGPKHLRLQADSRLMQCVAANGHPWWAVVMFLAVRIGGPWWLPFPSVRKVDGEWRLFFNGVRWGYGWPYPKYKAES